MTKKIKKKNKYLNNYNKDNFQNRIYLHGFEAYPKMVLAL